MLIYFRLEVYLFIFCVLSIIYFSGLFESISQVLGSDF